MTPALSLNRREGQQAWVHFYDYSILHFFLGENPCNLFNRIYDAFSHMDFVSSCSCDSLTRFFVSISDASYTTHTRIIVHDLTSISKTISPIQYSSQTSIYCFTSFSTSKTFFTSVITFLIYSSLCVFLYVASDFYFHVCSFMSSITSLLLSDYNRALVQLSYSTSYTSLMCLFMCM